MTENISSYYNSMVSGAHKNGQYVNIYVVDNHSTEFPFLGTMYEHCLNVLDGEGAVVYNMDSGSKFQTGIIE